MILRAIQLGLEMGGKAVAIMNSQDAERLGVLGLARIVIRVGMVERIAIVDTSPDLIHSGHIGIDKKAWIGLGLTEGLGNVFLILFGF